LTIASFVFIGRSAVIRLKVLRPLLVLVAACLAAGCEPAAEFSACRSRRIVEAGQLKAVAFVSSFEVTELARKQIVYNVRLIGRSGKPIPSTDGQFQNKRGHVAATRTFVAHVSPQRFDNIAVRIPAGQLEFTQKEIPVTAEVSVRTVEGKILASTACRVPVASVEELRPPLDRTPPDTREYWFIRPTDKGVPVLVGPFEDAKRAVQAYPDAPFKPRRLRSADRMWFVPLQRTEDPPGELLIGPCENQKDAGVLLKALVGAVKKRKVKLCAAPAERIRIAGWLQRRKDHPGAPQAQALRALRLLGIGLPAAVPAPTTQPTSKTKDR